MCTIKKKVLIKAFIESQFGCFSLIWMSHSIGGSTTQLTIYMSDRYGVYIKTILSLSKIHLKEICRLLFIRGTSLVIELFKIKGNLSNNVMYYIFQTRKINYNLRSHPDFASNCVNTNKFGLNSLRYFCSTVSSMVPLEIKTYAIVEIFKAKIRNWEPKDCYWYLCKTYINNPGFVNVI